VLDRRPRQRVYRRSNAAAQLEMTGLASTFDSRSSIAVEAAAGGASLDRMRCNGGTPRLLISRRLVRRDDSSPGIEFGAALAERAYW